MLQSQSSDPQNQPPDYRKLQKLYQTTREDFRKLQSAIGSRQPRGRRRRRGSLPQQSRMAEQRRVLPHDLAAERAVLGGILIDNIALDRVNLAPEDFFYRGHNLIFQAMQHIAALGTSIDRPTLYDALKKEPGHPPAEYLTSLADATPSAANIVDPAKIVREHADRRRLINLLEDGLQRAYTGEAVAPLRERLLQGVVNLADQRPDGFKSTPWAELKHTSQEQVGWVVDGLLRRGGLSFLFAAPKVGKSSTARTLTRAVALGLPWLGRDVQQGGVVYLALEEMPVDVQEHFHQMDLPETAPVEIVFEREPEATFKKLEQLIDKFQPSLVIVDTLIQLVQIGDINDYARTVRALQPLLALTRRSNAHVLCLHHARKSGGSHGAEGLGSQALSGIVDVILSLKRGEHYRIISSTQRRGCPLEESVLRLNEDTGLVELVGTKKAMDTELKGEEIMAFLEEQDEPVRMAAIQAELKSKRKPLNDTLRALVKQGKIGCAGSGKRGAPYRYFAVPEDSEKAAVSAAYREQQLSSDSKGLGPEKKAVPLFPAYKGEQKEQKI